MKHIKTIYDTEIGPFETKKKIWIKYNEQGKKIALTHRTVQMSNYIVALANDGNYD